MKTIGRNRTNYSRQDSPYVMSLLAAICMMVGGIIMIAPYLWYATLSNPTNGSSLGADIAIVLFVIGMPLSLIGTIGMIARRGMSGSWVESDVSRIRFATETQMINDLLRRK